MARKRKTGMVRVDRVITQADMRLTRKLAMEDYPVLRRIKPGHIVLMVNRAGTIMRYVDSERGIHTLYAKRGQSFDVRTLVEACDQWNLNIALHVLQGARARYAPEQGISLEPRPPRMKARRRKAARRKAIIQGNTGWHRRPGRRPA